MITKTRASQEKNCKTGPICCCWWQDTEWAPRKDATEVSGDNMCLWTEVCMAGSEIGDLPFTQFPFAALSFIPCVQSVTYSSKLGEQD